ncbi:hypothetical protein NLU13_7095 [Sarocladium strictum]|uniref:Uncharacterized protein n=1 Tax=Sarocladium strictum TaxID=5046 RepID=A0AA39GEM9_SARSR|nr:hypothetical protein NLU13_7095 [Sarocladium strictum]
MTTATPVQDAVPFLTDAAHLLRVSAPETSAHLMRHCADLLQQNGIPLPENHHQHSCASCGHIMIPGHDASSIQLRRAGPRAKRSRAASASAKTDPPPSASNALRKQMLCGLCGRVNSFKLDNGPRAARQNRKRPSVLAEPTPVSIPEDASSLKKQSNANSKKRAKNRKAGLQSLLAAGQSQKSKSLSLSDFMK